MNTTQKYILWIVIAVAVIAFILWMIKKSKNGKAGNGSATPSNTPTSTATVDTARIPYQQVPQVNATRMGVGGSVNRPSGSARVKGSGQN